MTQPSATPPVSSFRPASGWQHGAAPEPTLARASRSGLLVPGILLVAAFLVIGSQGAASTLSVGMPSGLDLVTTIALWSTSGVVLATLFALASRVTGLVVAAGAAALLDAVVIVVLMPMGRTSGWDAVQLVPILLAVAAAALGVLTRRDGEGRAALLMAAAAVALFYVSAAVVQVLRTGEATDLAATLARSLPIAALAIASALALHGSSTPALPAVLLWALALSLFIAPALAAAAGTPPVLASLVVLLLRGLLVLLAGVLVLRTSRRR
ncbi:hypothetical protein [Agrococcus sp. SGAir0287]|uniref:hypothetical protein n=1 Tax=Agrococcus sp. SGAir0287 TaxID=2070347 RepID=UPI0010CCC0D9|nr:hypothetical protein [Agrococcus sp. SGAir0287]QCR19945.1 hypothetical protein C1N71_11300 [Agrococcus sp. SGAir0287]